MRERQAPQAQEAPGVQDIVSYAQHFHAFAFKLLEEVIRGNDINGKRFLSIVIKKPELNFDVDFIEIF